MKCFLLTIVAAVSITASPIDAPNPIWHITALQQNPGDFAQPFAIKNTLAGTVTKGNVKQYGLLLNEAALNQAGGDFEQIAPVNAGILNSAGGTFRQKGLVNAGALNDADDQEIEGPINVQILNTGKRRKVKGALNIDLLNEHEPVEAEGLTITWNS